MIHQFYFTHCTYASSALERKTGEVASHPLGYSVRSGSVQGNALREIFRRLERYVYYYLPVDTPAPEKESLTAATSPLRLLFLPETDCGPVILQLAYRPKDTAGRIGSYFCHTLTSGDVRSLEKNTGAGATLSLVASAEAKAVFSMQAALQLWDASDWVKEDADWFPHDIHPLDSISSLLSGRSPAIDERVLNSFLTAESDGEFYDPKRVIPDRWRKMLVSERQHYFKTVLCGFLSMRDQAGASLLLAVEPSMAALLFYGIGTFFPQSLVRNQSFSTYEPQPERLLTKLAATTFRDPEKNDLEEEHYHGRHFVLNTWNGRTSNFDSALMTASYVAYVWKQFLAGGVPQVQVFCRTFNSVNVASISDLQAMMEVENTYHQILSDGEAPASCKPLPFTFGELSMASSRMAVTLLKRRLAEGLAKIMAQPQAEAEKLLSRIAGTPGHLLLLELLGNGGALQEVQQAVLFLTQRLPEKFIARWLQASTASDDFKARFLENWVRQACTLPGGCEFLWKLTMDSMKLAAALSDPLASSGRNAASGDAGGPQPPVPNAGILPLVFPKLPLEVLLECMKSPSTAKFQKEMVLAVTFGVAQALEGNGRSSEVGRKLCQTLDQFIQRVPESLFREIYRTYGNWFFLNYPGDSQFLGQKFALMEGALFQKPAEISEKLKILFDIQGILPESVAQRVENWEALRQAIQPITTFQAQSGRKMQPRALDQACEALAKTAYTVFDDARLFALCGGPKTTEFAKIGPISATLKEPLIELEMQILATLCQQWYAADFLPAGNRTHELMLKKLRFFFQTQVWNTSRTGSSNKKLLVLLILGGIGIGLLAVLLFFILYGRIGSEPETALETPEPAAQTESSREPKAEDSNSEEEEELVEYEYDEDDENREDGEDGGDSDDREDGEDGEGDGVVEPGAPNSGIPGVRAKDSAELVDAEDELKTPDSGDGNAEGTEDAGESEESKEPEMPGVSYSPTSPQTRMEWDEVLQQDRLTRFCVLEMGKQMRMRTDSAGFVTVLRSRKAVSSMFSADERDSLALKNGYVFFDGTAYPFGDFPAKSVIQPPTPISSDDPDDATVPEDDAPENVLQSENLGPVFKSQPGRSYEIPELANALGVETVVLEFAAEPGGMDAQQKFVLLKIRFKEEVEPASASVSTESQEELEIRFRNIKTQFNRCEKHRKNLQSGEPLSEEMTGDFRKLDELLEPEKLANLTFSEVDDSMTDEQRQAAEDSIKRVCEETIPGISKRAQEKMELLKTQLAELSGAVKSSKGGWTPVQERILQRIQGSVRLEGGSGELPVVTAVFSSENFLFDVPFPSKFQKILDEAARRVQSEKKADSVPESQPGILEESEESTSPNDLEDGADAFESATLSEGIQEFPEGLEGGHRGQMVTLLTAKPGMLKNNRGDNEDVGMRISSKKGEKRLKIDVRRDVKADDLTVNVCVHAIDAQGKLTHSVDVLVLQKTRGDASLEYVKLVNEETQQVLVSFQILDDNNQRYVTPYYWIDLRNEDGGKGKNGKIFTLYIGKSVPKHK